MMIAPFHVKAKHSRSALSRTPLPDIAFVWIHRIALCRPTPLVAQTGLSIK
jgi:hypothetical protein